MHEDDAKFEADIVLAIAAVESMKLPGNPVARLYALLWCASASANEQPAGRDLFERAAQESADNFPWQADPFPRTPKEQR